MHPSHPNTDTAAPHDGYTPARLKPRHDGWTAERQRTFLSMLAESGRVSVAAEAAGVTPRSAYRMRHHPQGHGFAQAWDQALLCGAARLTAIALERATVGGMREMWRDGVVVSETRVPSDRLLVFLLQHLAPHQFGAPGTAARTDDRALVAQAGFGGRLDALTDIAAPADPIGPAEYRPVPLEARQPHAPETRD